MRRASTTTCSARRCKKALYNYMHGIGLEHDVREWFEDEVPRTRVPKTFVARALKAWVGTCLLLSPE